MKKQDHWTNIGIITFFVFALVMVEVGPWGSQSLAAYNGGYGTFDMKHYNVDMVYSIMPQYINGGISMANKYYMVDYLFIVAFLMFQVMISTAIYKNVNSQVPRKIFVGIAIIRAVADAIENALLLCIINTYPMRHEMIVTIASSFTQLKLGVIPLWVGLLIIGFICNFVKFKGINARRS